MTEKDCNLLEKALVKGKPVFFVFFWGRLPEQGGSIFLRGGAGGCDLVVISLSLRFNYDNLILKLHQKKCSYLDEGWLFIGRFKVGSVPGMSVVLVASKNESIKIHEYDARPLIKSYISY